MGKSAIALMLGSAFIVAAPCAPSTASIQARAEIASLDTGTAKPGYEKSVRIPPSYGFVASGTMAFVSSR